jgi:hypothetical protein
MCNIHAGAFLIIDLGILYMLKCAFASVFWIISSEAISIFLFLFFFIKSESGLHMCCSNAICIVYVLLFNMQ